MKESNLDPIFSYKQLRLCINYEHADRKWRYGDTVLGWYHIHMTGFIKHPL